MYKVKAAIAGGVLAAMMAAAALSGTIISAMSDNSYKSWKQYGESWSSMTLGSSGETVARSGCAVTSAAILMVKSGSVTDDSFTPGTIVGFMSSHGGFSSSGSINWSKLTEYAPSFVYCGKSTLSGTQQQKAEKMQSLMDQGYYLEAVVRNGGHFVAIDSVNGSNVTMMDPGSRATSLFDQYAASGVISLRLFKGANSTVTAPEPTEPETTAAEMTETTTEAVTEVVTEETTTLYTTEPATEETTEVTTSTQTETTIATTEETTTTTTVVTTTTQAPVTTTAPTVTTTAAAATTPAPAPAPAPAAAPETQPETPVFIVQEPTTEVQTVIPSRAEAELFRIRNKNIFMTVRFTTTDNLHLREEANTDSDILLVIPEGTALDVVEIDEDFTWGRVAYNGKEGWISLDFAGL
jgi:uncharacterized protein YgiM (DUF1202 family)